MAARKKDARVARGEETRAKILAAALALFRRHGYAQTTMRQVAESAGVALGGAYHYFPSKEAIVLAYYDETQRRSSVAAAAAFAKSADPRARLGAVMHGKIDVLAKDRKLLAGLFHGIADPSSATSVFGEATRAVRDDSIRLFEEALCTSNEYGLLPPDAQRVLVLAMWSLHMGLLLFFVHDTSAGQNATRSLIDSTLDLVCDLMPVAPALAPILGERIGAILRQAGLLAPP